MPDSNPGPLPQKSGALPMSHHIYKWATTSTKSHHIYEFWPAPDSDFWTDPNTEYGSRRTPKSESGFRILAGSGYQIQKTPESRSGFTLNCYCYLITCITGNWGNYLNWRVFHITDRPIAVSLGNEMGLGIRERVRRLDRPLPSLPASEVGVVTVLVP